MRRLGKPRPLARPAPLGDWTRALGVDFPGICKRNSLRQLLEHGLSRWADDHAERESLIEQLRHVDEVAANPSAARHASVCDMPPPWELNGRKSSGGPRRALAAQSQPRSVVFVLEGELQLRPVERHGALVDLHVQLHDLRDS